MKLTQTSIFSHFDIFVIHFFTYVLNPKYIVIVFILNTHLLKPLKIDQNTLNYFYETIFYSFNTNMNTYFSPVPLDGPLS